MSYFSRLTDIVTCNLSEILANEADPQAAILQIIREVEEGLGGAQRSVATATASAERLSKELDEHRSKIADWVEQARRELSAGKEDQARLALIRKRELEDVIAGLEQQHKAAVSTRDHLTTMQRAIEGRLQEARRKLTTLDSESVASHQSSEAEAAHESFPSPSNGDDARRQEIESELEALKRELDAGS